jgi:hypothetical protein
MKSRRAPRLTREQSLGALPVRNALVSYRRTEGDEMEITVPRRNDWLGKLIAVVFMAPKDRKVVLDRIGADMWELCDGQHTVQAMVDSLVAKYKLNRREAEASLTQHLRNLGKRRLIAFAIPKDAVE